MESYNQSINGSSNDTEGVPLFVTYLSMITSLTSVIVVIPPAVTVINVIWQTRELHTNYFFFIAQLIATKATWIIVASVQAYLIIVLYLLDLNSDSADIALKWTSSIPFILLYLMAILLPITVAIERMIVIAFPFHHRSIITTKTVAIMLAAMWGLSTILTIIIMITVPRDIVWPLGIMLFHQKIYPILLNQYQ